MVFFSTLAGALISRSLYRAARNESGYRIGYSVLLALLGGLVMSIVTVSQIHGMLLAVPEGKSESPLANALHQIAEQIPLMTLDNGKLMTRDPGATLITLTWNNEGEPFALATIDTRAEANSSDMKTPILITDEEIFIKTERKTELHDIDELLERDDDAPPLIINRTLVRDLADGLLQKLDDNLTLIATVLGMLLWFLLGIWFVIGRLVLVFALGICGMVAGVLAKASVTYQQSVRLAALSFTPLALADMASIVLRGHTLSLPLLFILGSIAVAAAVITTRDTPLAPAP